MAKPMKKSREDTQPSETTYLFSKGMTTGPSPENDSPSFRIQSKSTSTLRTKNSPSKVQIREQFILHSRVRDGNSKDDDSRKGKQEQNDKGKAQAGRTVVRRFCLFRESFQDLIHGKCAPAKSSRMPLCDEHFFDIKVLRDRLQSLIWWESNV